METLKIKLNTFIEEAKIYHEKYQNFLPAIFFSAGFLFDVFTLGEVDDASNIFVLSFYLFLSTIILAIEYKQIQIADNAHKFVKIFFEYQEDIFHFLCGSLLSAFTLFYFKSSSLSNSFIFMGLMASILLLNEIEFFKRKGILVRTSMYMLCLVSFLIYIFPIVFASSSQIIFYGCVIGAFIMSTVSFFTLTSYNGEKKKNLEQLLIPHAIVCLLFFVLYSFKVVPPLPLSLKYMGVFHNVEKLEEGYQVSHENPWWKFWNHGDQEFVAWPNDKIFFFTNIFAPGGFDEKVYIHWLLETNDGLKTTDRIPLQITGGRSEGFRGYAYKQNFSEGDYQIRVESSEGIEIGRINLSIKKVEGQKHIRNFKKIKM